MKIQFPVSDYFVAKKCGDVPKLRYANIQLGVTCCLSLNCLYPLFLTRQKRAERFRQKQLEPFIFIEKRMKLAGKGTPENFALIRKTMMFPA